MGDTLFAMRSNLDLVCEYQGSADVVDRYSTTRVPSAAEFVWDMRSRQQIRSS